MKYAEYSDVEIRLNRTFTESDKQLCEALLSDAAVIIDSYNCHAKDAARFTVSCNMVCRAMGTSAIDVPMGATQGSMSALGYSQSWTMSGGSTGELYLSKMDKKLLGSNNKIGSHSILEDMT